MKTIDWCELDARHPIAARSKYTFPDESTEVDGWLNVEACLANTDENIDEGGINKIH